MQSPYYIQRMKRVENPSENPSVDDLYRMDYMGSAEFEFGALPKSLKRMTKVFDELVVQISVIKDFKKKPLYLLGTAKNVHEYQNFIPELFYEKIHLKERLEHTYAWKGKGGYGITKYPFKEFYHPTAWWDIDNDVMFTFGKKHAENLRKAIGVVRDKKMAQGKSEWY